MSKPGTIHQLRATPTTPNPEHVDIPLADALHIRDLMTLTQDQHVPEGIIGEAHGYPLIIIHDDEPPAA